MDLRQLEKMAVILRSYRGHSAAFVRDIIGIEPQAWQEDALNAFDKGSNIAIRSGHGVGKTALLAWIVIYCVALYPFCKVPCTAPTQHQLNDVLWPEINRWITHSKIDGLLNWTATKVSPVGYDASTFAVARSSKVPENMAGFHAPKIVYVVDEGSGVPNKIFEVVEGALTTMDAQIVTAGNPTAIGGYYYDAFHKNRHLWYTAKVSSEDSANVSPAYCLRFKELWGEDSDIYRVRVLGEFPLAESDTFIRLNYLESAVARGADNPARDTYARPEMGVDVARFGNDETVIAIRQGLQVVHIEAFRNKPTTYTSGRVSQLIAEFAPAVVRIDDVGVGGGVFDQVCENEYKNDSVSVVGFNNGSSGDEEGWYDNLATWSWGHFRNLLQQEEVTLPDDDLLVGQLSTRKYQITAKGRLRLERKEDMTKRGLPSPDRAEAVVMAFADFMQSKTIDKLVGGKREAFALGGL